MVAVDKPVSACCNGVIFLIRGIRKESPDVLELEAEIQKPIYGCRVCGKECEVVEDK